MKATLTALAAALMLAAVTPVLAHHSVDAEFDRNAPVEVTGTVTKVDFMNPHIWIYLNVKGEDGGMVPWQFEGGPPNALRRNGWKPNSLKVGDTVTIQGILAKDGSNTGNARVILMPDGSRVLSGNNNDNDKGK